MTDVFISYSRKDAEFMRLLHKKLQEAERDVWVDWEDIPATADWWHEIKTAIEAADAFAFIISSNSVRSEVCRDEIQHAIDNNKRFIPLLFHEMTDEDAPFVHSAIRSHNWIPFNDPEKYDESVKRLLDALSTDPDYLRQHTRLLVRAKEWVQEERHVSYLLKGAELNQYQKWLLDSQRLQPKPTELQLEYVLASQNARARTQMRIAGGVIVGVIVFALIVGFALLQNQRLRETAQQATIEAQVQEADDQAQLATSQAQDTQIAAQSTNIANIRNDSRNLLTQAYVLNTQSALQTENFSLRETITAFPTSSLALVTATALPLETLETEEEDNGSGLSPEDSPTPDSEPGIEPEMSPSPDEAEAQGVATQIVASPPPMATEPQLRPTQPEQRPSQLPETGGGDSGRPDYFVNPFGDDNANCRSPQTGCLTVGAAIAKASEGDTIEIAPSVYDESLVIDKSLRIIGLEGDNTVLNGNFVDRVVTIREGATVHIENLMITGGTALYGGGILNEGELYLLNVVVVGNFADLAGGGIANFGILGTLDTDFSENYATVVSEIYTAGSAQTTVNNEVLAPVAEQGVIAPNVLIVIDTTDGDMLNMRDEPGVRSEIVSQIAPQSIALVIGESEQVGDLTWWLVYLPSGEIGWIVENVDGIQVITPLE